MTQLTGAEYLKSQLNNVPTLPGIYQMLDINKQIIYIGKAKNLRNRLIQYTRELVGKNQLMVSLICELSYLIANSESEALMLEAQLIKKFKPKFNILLKDDKFFPYIKLRLDHDYPQLQKFRGKNLVGGKFFGPFASAKHVDTTLLELQRIFKLRTCSDSFFKNRTRPCMEYQIKRCSGPCVNKISYSEYQQLVTQVKAFLSGKNQKLQNILSSQMERYSQEMLYEKAAEMRDKIKAISYIQLRAEKSHNLKDADIIALAIQNDTFCIQLFLYRNHQPCGHQTYFFNDELDNDPANIISSFIMQLYQQKTPPKQIITSHLVENESEHIQALKELHQITVQFKHPKTGAVYKILQNAVDNAQLALQKHLKNSARNSANLALIQELFKLPLLPNRLEIYDNSHIQGAFPVGAMVVAGPDGFEKNEYRLFNIRDVDPNKAGGDDYFMLRQVLKRRLQRLKNEPHRRPDLMIIDGGKGHMQVVQQVMTAIEVSIPFVCMSKGVDRNSGQEQFHTPNNAAFTLDKKSSLMKYLQILRDEVHNFAINSHRRLRSKAIQVSSLEHLDGIGKARKKALLHYFGSFQAITEASVEDLAKVEGISLRLAENIYQALHTNNASIV